MKQMFNLSPSLSQLVTGSPAPCHQTNKLALLKFSLVKHSYVESSIVRHNRCMIKRTSFLSGLLSSVYLMCARSFYHCLFYLFLHCLIFKQLIFCSFIVKTRRDEDFFRTDSGQILKQFDFEEKLTTYQKKKNQRKTQTI